MMELFQKNRYPFTDNRLSQLKIDFIDNINFCQKHIGRNGLHLNESGKNRLKLNVFNEIWKYENIDGL